MTPGARTAVRTYDEYGNPGPTNTGRYQYTGQTWLSDAGLYHYKNRAYHPGLMRFMQADPIGHSGGINLYAYVGGDPVNFIDPWGLKTEQNCGPEREPDGEGGCRVKDRVLVTPRYRVNGGGVWFGGGFNLFGGGGGGVGDQPEQDGNCSQYDGVSEGDEFLGPQSYWPPITAAPFNEDGSWNATFLSQVRSFAASPLIADMVEAGGWANRELAGNAFATGITSSIVWGSSDSVRPPSTSVWPAIRFHTEGRHSPRARYRLSTGDRFGSRDVPLLIVRPDGTARVRFQGRTHEFEGATHPISGVDC